MFDQLRVRLLLSCLADVLFVFLFNAVMFFSPLAYLKIVSSRDCILSRTDDDDK